MKNLEQLKSEMKERGHKVVTDISIDAFDKFIDKAEYDLRFVDYVLDICEIMRDEKLSIQERRRKAYDRFNEYDHSGSTAHGCLHLLRRFCFDGWTLAEEIEDFKYDPNGSLSERRAYTAFMIPIWEREQKIRENLRKHQEVCMFEVYNERLNEKTSVKVYTTNNPMFLIELPYKWDITSCFKLVHEVGQRLSGVVYGVFNNTPIFSFDTKKHFFMRYQELTEEEYKK